MPVIVVEVAVGVLLVIVLRATMLAVDVVASIDEETLFMNNSPHLFIVSLSSKRDH